MQHQVHPTRQKLLDAASALLDRNSPDDVTVDMVLKAAGVSKGSFYYHFDDFQDLVETTLIAMFVVGVDQSITALSAVVHGSPDRETMLAGLREVTRQTQSSDNRYVRFRRARLLAFAADRPRLLDRLSTEQSRLTATLTDLFRACQDKGWFNTGFDPKAGAVMIQAYTFGKLVDDVTEDQVDPDSWCDLIMQIALKVFC